MKQIFYFLIFHFHCISSKLIASNTLQEISRIELHEQEIKLTVWIQIRFLVKNQEQLGIEALKIIDQEQNDQIIINLLLIDEYTMGLYLNLQNKSIQTHKLQRDDWKLEWQKIEIYRDLCFNRLQYFDINMSIQCENNFNATLYVGQSILFHLYVYDGEEFVNEEIILQNILLKDNRYTINTLKDKLIIKFYAKFYCCVLNLEIFFYFTLLQTNDQIYFFYDSDNIGIQLRDDDLKMYEILTIAISNDQWILFSIEFDEIDIIIQYNINNTNNIFEVQLDHYLNINPSLIQNYQFRTCFVLSNYKAIVISYLQIISLVQGFYKNSCIKDCQFCLFKKCLDKEKTLDHFNISNEIKSSIYYNQSYFQNYQSECNDKHYYINEGQCIELPKYKGQFCYKCEILQKSINHLSYSNYLKKSIPMNSYDYYLESLQNVDYIEQYNNLFYEKDLNIFIMKVRDIYLTYQLSNYVYCELGYSYFNNKCKKIIKSCEVSIQSFCQICKQQYALINFKCIKCQKNCLYCKMIKNKLICILLTNDYFQTSNGLIKQCIKSSQIFNCLSKEQAIYVLTQKGHQICQRSQIYDIFQTQCQDVRNFQEIFQFVEYYTIQNKYNQKQLEYQDTMIEQLDQLDQQIYDLIYLQQISKLSQLVQEYNMNQSIIQMNKNFELLTQMNSSVEEISIQKIIMKEIHIFLQHNPIIMYQNMRYSYLIDISKKLLIQFKIIQFDIIFFQCSNEKNLLNFIGIDYDKYENITFILNISFNFNPSILYKHANQLHLKANEILINNFLFDYIDEQNDEDLLNYYIFDILSEKMIITNLTIQNVILYKLFYIQDFNSLKVQNIWIINSTVLVFIMGLKKDIINDQIVQISDIYSNRSTLVNFIEILNAQIISIQNIFYESTTVMGVNFRIYGKIELIKINYFQLVNVTISTSYLLNSIYLDNQKKTECFMSNIYFHHSKVVNSSLFLIKNAYQLSLQKIYLDQQIFMESKLIHFYNLVNVQIERIFMNYITIIEGQLSLILIQGYNKSKLKDFYIRDFKATNQIIFILRGNQTLVQNFNFHRIDLIFTSLMEVQSQEIKMVYFLFQNFDIQHSGFYTIILFSSKNLNMQRLVFKQAQINGTYLIFVSSIDKFYLKNLRLHDFHILTNKAEGLILLGNAFKNNEISEIYFESIIIKTWDKNYTLFQLQSNNLLCRIVMINFLMKTISNQSPFSAIYIILANLLQIELYNIQVQNTYSINFIYSGSSVLVMNSFYIQNSFRTFVDQQSFITHKSSQVLYNNETIDISNFKVNNFQGTFLVVDTDSNMQMLLKDLTFNWPLIIFSFLKLTTTNQFQSKLYLYKLQIRNQYPYEQYEQPTAFIQSNFNFLIIKNVYIYNISSQLLNIKARKLTISDIYVCKYIASYTIIFFQCQSINFTQILSGILIEDSQIQGGYVFQMILCKQNLRFDDIKIIDVSVNNTVFKLESKFNESPVKFSNILLKGVISNQFFFYVSLSANYFTTSIIGGTSAQIFNSDKNNIGLIKGLITNIKQKCQLSGNSSIYLYQSEIVNSNILQSYDKLVSYMSLFQGISTDINSQIMIFLSLDNGRSSFNLIQIEKNLYQVQFSINNSYLYLPSGRDIHGYHYFNFATRQYTKLYDSMSYINYYSDISKQCILNQNFNNQTIYNQDIVIFPGVNKINNLTITLNPYFKDKFIELDLICNQNEEQITYRTLIKTFNCQLGEHLHNDKCLPCDIEQHLYSVGYNQQYCLYIDQNTIQQLNIGQIKLYKSFWRHAYANKYIEQCKNQNCLGGWKTGDNSCEVGYVGALCSECDVYNVRGLGSFGKIEDQCSICYFDYSIYFKGFLIIIFQLLLIFISLNTNKQLSQQYLFMRISKRQFTQILQRQNINQVNILFKLYYNYLFTLYLLKESINFGQIIDLSLNMVYNPSFIAVPQFDCLIYTIFQYPIQYTQLIIKILLPISLLNLIVIIYALLIKFKLSKYSIYVIILCLLIIHQQNQQVILQSLIKLLSPVKYSNVYWSLENLDIQYFSKVHQHYIIVLIIPLIILITIINILIFIWIRYINKRIFIHLKLSLFIYKQYKNELYYWEHFRLAFIYLFMLILYSYENGYILLLTIFIITISHIYKPFELQNINQIDQIIYILSLYTYFGIMYHQKDDSLNKFIIIVFSNIILLKLFFKYFLHSLNIQYRQQKIKYLNQMIKYMPKLGSIINISLYDKNEYYYNLMRQSRKQKTPINTIAQSTVSKINLEVQAEVEMTQIKIKQ